MAEIPACSQGTQCQKDEGDRGQEDCAHEWEKWTETVLE